MFVLCLARSLRLLVFSVVSVITPFARKCCLVSVLCTLCFSAAAGFDPTTIAMGSQAVSGILGGLDKADEMADIGFALGDLLSELGLDADGETEMKGAVRKLEDLNSKARDLRWSKDEVRMALDHDLNQANSITDKLKALRNMISASKKIAAIMGYRPKAGEKAVQIQEIRINAMVLEELQGMRRAQFLAYLEDRETKARREIFMQEIVEEEHPGLGVPRMDKLKVNIGDIRGSRRGDSASSTGGPIESAGSASSRWDSALPPRGRSSVPRLSRSTLPAGGGL